MWYGFFLGLGLSILAISAYILFGRVHFIKKGPRTKATVIEFQEEKDSDNYVTYRPVFRFTTHTGREVTFKLSYSSQHPYYSIGEDVVVAYDADHPEQAVILKYFASFGWGVMLAALAMPMVVIGGGYYWARAFFEGMVLR